MAEDDKHKLWPLIIRHYRSQSGRRGSKGVVVERVTPGSDTARFFERMEKRRLAKACDKTIDLRGRVAGECKRYVYKMRSHYMDETSYQTFRSALRENGGVFTVATFEAIVNAAHVNKISVPPAKSATKPAAKSRNKTATQLQAQTHTHIAAAPAAATPPAATSQSPSNDAQEPANDDYFHRINPPIVPFGYYHKRKDPRLVYTTSAEIAVAGAIIAARTRDLSLGGMLVTAPGTNSVLAAGQQVRVSFPELKAMEGGGCADIAYRVTRIETKDNETLAALIRADRSAEPQFNAFLERLITNESAKHKLDPEDDLCTATTLAYERLYSAAVTHLPLFFKLNEAGTPTLHSIGVTQHNQLLVNFFAQEDGTLDLSALQIPERVRRLCLELAFSSLQHEAAADATAARSHALLIAYQDKQGRVNTVADFEVASPQDKLRLLRYAMLHTEYRIFKIGMTLVRDHDMAKMELLSAGLAKKAADEANALRKEVRGMFALGTLADVTAPLVQQLRGAASMMESAFKLDGLFVYRGAERVPLGPPKPGEPATTVSLLPEPKRIPFGFYTERREERFLAKTKVEMEVNGQRVAGLTRDVSTRGACLMFDHAPTVRPGDHVTLDFLSFTKKSYDCDIHNIPYRVLRVVREDMHYVMLEREKSPEWDQVTAFFKEIIEINRQKLGVCVADVQSMAAARLYEEALSAHLLSTPVFFSSDDRGRLSLQRVAVSEYSPQLADYFYIGPQLLDYRAFNGQALLKHLAEALRKAGKNKQPGELLQCDLILYKEVDAQTGATAVRCVADFELSSAEERAQLIDQAITGGALRVMRLVVAARTDNVQREVESYIESARAASRHRAAKLEQEIANVSAIGDLLDITSEVLEARAMASMRS